VESWFTWPTINLIPDVSSKAMSRSPPWHVDIDLSFVGYRKNLARSGTCGMDSVQVRKLWPSNPCSSNNLGGMKVVRMWYSLQTNLKYHPNERFNKSELAILGDHMSGHLIWMDLILNSPGHLGSNQGKAHGEVRVDQISHVVLTWAKAGDNLQSIVALPILQELVLEST
jgi:hypothetical protein